MNYKLPVGMWDKMDFDVLSSDCVMVVLNVDVRASWGQNESGICFLGYTLSITFARDPIAAEKKNYLTRNLARPKATCINRKGFAVSASVIYFFGTTLFQTTDLKWELSPCSR